MRHPLNLIDAFAREPFSGNPAAICLLIAPGDATWMQRVAMEMNQAETAFLVPETDGYSLRWFTPATEVELCGHATLAAAHFLFTGGHMKGSIAFKTLSGVLTAVQIGDEIELDFPAEPPAPCELPHPLRCLGAEVLWSGANRMDWFVRLPSAADVRRLKPDFGEISALGHRGLIVTGAGDEGYDFVSRCFYPQTGIDEDPVTGSAHCALSPYWAAELGRSHLVGYQASRRGGVVKVESKGSRVKLRGRAITTVTGWLLHDDPLV